MEHPKTAPWGLQISVADVAKLAAGFEPQQMEDRWLCRCSTETSSVDGTTAQVARFHRSWTGDEQVSIRIIPAEGGDEKTRGSVITDITWDQRKEPIVVTEDEAKKMVVNLSRGLLGCELGSV